MCGCDQNYWARAKFRVEIIHPRFVSVQADNETKEGLNDLTAMASASPFEVVRSPPVLHEVDVTAQHRVFRKLH